MSVRPRPTLACTAAALLLASLLASPASAIVGPQPPTPTASRYVVLSGDAAADRTQTYDAGCEAGRSGVSGMRLLFFGTQEASGVLRPPGTTVATQAPRVPAEATVEAVRHWAAGFAACRGNAAGGASAGEVGGEVGGEVEATIALGVNNKSDGGLDGATAGAAWADIVERAAAAIDEPQDGIEVTGALDAEPSWSPPAWARSWVDAFTANSERDLYAANSADGCPPYGPDQVTCNNGWTIEDAYHVATGAAETVHAVPQIYTTDGAQARQWAAISAWGARELGTPLRVVGALSQHTACEQRHCDGTDNTPEEAWWQLWDALAAQPETRVSELPVLTDVRWP